MKASGIIRRVDDLGRIVIPREIRRTNGIREGTPMEIFHDKDGGILLKKYQPARDLLDQVKCMDDDIDDLTSEIDPEKAVEVRKMVYDLRKFLEQSDSPN